MQNKIEKGLRAVQGNELLSIDQKIKKKKLEFEQKNNFARFG